MTNRQLQQKIMDFIEAEHRSLSMEVITPEYVYMMWGGEVLLEDIQRVMTEL